MRVGLMCVFAAAAASASEPKLKPARVWKNTGDGAEVVAATFLGGNGHEWLCGGGFARDGSVILVGNVAGPEFDLGVPVRVIGTDLPEPPKVKRVPVMDKGKQKADKDGNLMWEKPSWRHDGVTAFVACLSADMKKVTAVRRFPWTSGAATAAVVGPGGEICVAGRATDGIAKLGSNVAELPAGPPGGKDKGRCEYAFIAKLTADGSKAVWVRYVHGPSAAPTVSVSADGKQVRFGAGSLFTLDADGTLLGTVHVPGGLKTTSSVSPVDGSMAVGGEHHWPTGREPWRCPTLNIHAPDGKVKYQLYDWGGPYVGLNNCRQVSDSAVRFVTHDTDGGILFYAWSDGGNSVMTTEPFDVRTPVRPKGLGLTAAGAGVLSCSYLIRLDPTDYRATAWTFWCAQSESGRPNSVWVQTMTRAPGGPLAVAGHGAWGIWQTATKLSDAEPWGEYVAAFSEDFSQLRFCSVIPGAGVAEVADGAASRGGQWGIATGIVNGKARVLFVGSATAGRDENGKTVPTPTRNPAQGKFGGGWCDGYAVLLELPPSLAKRATVESPQPGPSRASFEGAARGKDPKKGGAVPEDGTVFHFSATYPKHVTVDVEIRDRAGKLWPNFLYGKPIGGTLTHQQKDPEAKIAVACTALCQPAGEQNRRVIGEWVKDPKSPPAVTFALESLAGPKRTNVQYFDKGKERPRPVTVEYFDGKGMLAVGGKKLPVAPRVTLEYSAPKAGPVEAVQVSAFVTLKASELGLAALAPDAAIDLRISMSGTTRTEAPPKTKK